MIARNVARGKNCAERKGGVAALPEAKIVGRRPPRCSSGYTLSDSRLRWSQPRSPCGFGGPGALKLLAELGRRFRLASGLSSRRENGRHHVLGPLHRGEAHIHVGPDEGLLAHMPQQGQ